jgi:hypothetical protein
MESEDSEMALGHQETVELIRAKENLIVCLEEQIDGTPTEQADRVAELENSIRLERMALEVLKWSLRDVG